MPDDDFSNAPHTITELRAARSDKASDWTGRDALVHLLREHDAGRIRLGKVVVIFEDEAVDRLSYSRSTGSLIECIGLLEMGKLLCASVQRSA